MKTTLKTLFIALLATVTFSACSNDDEFASPETEDLIGRWYIRVADERVCVDGATWYTFNADGTFVEEYYDALAKPDEQSGFIKGNWYLKKSDGKTVLVIHINYTNPYTNEDKSQTVEYTILKFSTNSFLASIRRGGYETEYKFKRSENDNAK